MKYIFIYVKVLQKLMECIDYEKITFGFQKILFQNILQSNYLQKCNALSPTYFQEVECLDKKLGEF